MKSPIFTLKDLKIGGKKKTNKEEHLQEHPLYRLNDRIYETKKGNKENDHF